MTEIILIVDQDSHQRSIVSHTITTRLGYPAAAVENIGQARNYILQHTHAVPSLILMDVSVLPLKDFDPLREWSVAYPDVPVIMMTQYGDVEKAAAAQRAGAIDVLPKPVSMERLGLTIRNTIHTASLRREVDSLRRLQQGQFGFGDLVGISPTFRRAIENGKEAAASEMGMVIEGERGTGKLNLARAIHGASRRRGRHFIVFDCQNLSEFPAVLFPLKEAAEGTLFLKEISALSPVLQERLARELQGYMGRIIASSSRPLQPLVAQERFRHDLYARLQSLRATLPPLRERREDIQPLAEHFMRCHASAEGAKAVRFTSAATGLLVSQPWHGNVRQLQQTIYRAVLLGQRDSIDIDDFQTLISQACGQTNGGNGPLASLHLMQKASANPVRSSVSVLTLVDDTGHLKRMEQVEAEIIRFAIGYYSGHMSEVARRLGIGRSTLYRKMQDMDIGETAQVRSIAM